MSNTSTSVLSSGAECIAAQHVEIGGAYYGPARGEDFGLGGCDPEVPVRIVLLAAAGEFGDDPEGPAGRQDLSDAVEEGRLVVDPPVDQAAGDDRIRGIRQGAEVVGDEVHQVPGRPVAPLGVAGRGDGAGREVDADGAVTELVKVAGE